MPYQVIRKVTFKEPGSPTLSEFLTALDPAVLADVPDSAGKTPIDYLNEEIALYNSYAGFVERIAESDSNSETLTYVWESKQAMLDATGKENPPTASRYWPGPFDISAPSTGTDLEYLKSLYANQYIADYTISFKEV